MFCKLVFMNSPVWDDGRWQSLPSLMRDVETDVCVIGLGGSGLSCIHELLDLGQKVIGLDAGRVAGGATGRNGGFLLAGLAAFYHDAVKVLGRDRAKAIYQLTLEQTGRILEETPDACNQTGSLRIALDDEAFEDCKKQYDALKLDGFPVEHYRGKEGRGLLFPVDAAFNPLQRCRILAEQALERGANLYENSPVIDIQSHEVRTDKALIHCQHVVVAVDGRLEVIFPEIKDRVRTSRLQMLGTAPTNEVRVPRPVYLRWGYEYYQQLSNGSIALGGFRDHALDEEWTVSMEPGKTIQDKLTAFLRTHIGVRAPITHRWAASVSYTDGVLPFFKEVRSNVWGIGAYNGTGNIIGAICGRAVAQKVIKGSSNVADLLTESCS